MAKKGQKLQAAGGAVLIAEPALALAHTGGLGVVVGLFAGVATYLAVDDLEAMTGREFSLPVPQSHREPGDLPLMYRLLNGKSTREQRELADDLDDLEGDVEDDPEDEPDTDAGTVQLALPAQFQLGSRTLAAIKEVNRKRFIYFGRTATREVVLALDEMYHVLDVAKSGRGKSNRFRLGMMQVVGLAQTYYLNPFAAPVKSVTDAREIEVWQPIYDRLANGHPVRERAEIEQVLGDLVGEIEARSEQEQRRDFSWRQRPVFVFIDEVPEIFARCPTAVKLLDRIGRSGRQFGVFAWIATQSALVSDLGLSTASQAQFKTLIYGGADKTSGSRVMGSVSAAQEKVLKTNGAGLTLMIADGLDETAYVRAPLLTNEALFASLDLPPFQREDWLGPVDGSQQPGRRFADRRDTDLSFSSERHPSPPFFARHETPRPPIFEREREMKEPGERDEKHESFSERGASFTERDERFIPSHEEEVAVLTAVLQMNTEGVNVTREAIKQRLGWNNAKHPVVKFVCDKHNIAVR